MVMGDMETYTELLIIGSGPSGYSAAFRGAELGLDVTMVDPAILPGGNYLHSHCIPAKNLFHLTQTLKHAKQAAIKGLNFTSPAIDLTTIKAWRDHIIQATATNLITMAKKYGVQLIRGLAKFEDSTTVRLTGAEISRIRFKYCLIATGARPIALPDFPFNTDSRIMSTAAALHLTDIPSTLLVVGGGPTGIEIGSLYATFGSRVTLAEKSEHLLPGIDRDLVAPVEKRLTQLFTDIKLNTQVDISQEFFNEVEVTFKTGSTSNNHRFDRVLVAVGLAATTDSLGLKQTAITVDDQGFILVDKSQKTSEKNIFATGDITGQPMLAHKAIRAGRVAAEVIAGRTAVFDVQATPIIVYTEPQICWCGLTERQAAKNSTPYITQKYSWKNSAHAQTMDTTDGFTKLLVDPENNRILGAGICGSGSESLIAEAVLAIEMGALAEDLALTLHPHPTTSATYEATAELFKKTPAPT